MLFTPVAPESLVNSDDLFRSKRSVNNYNMRPKRATDVDFPEHWINIQFRTLVVDGLLLFAASGQDFTLIDVSLTSRFHFAFTSPVLLLFCDVRLRYLML